MKNRAVDPHDFDANVGLFYALCDANYFVQARAHSDALAARPLDAEKKFKAEIFSAWERAYEGRLEVAHDCLTMDIVRGILAWRRNICVLCNRKNIHPFSTYEVGAL